MQAPPSISPTSSEKVPPPFNPEFRQDDINSLDDFSLSSAGSNGPDASNNGVVCSSYPTATTAPAAGYYPPLYPPTTAAPAGGFVFPNPASHYPGQYQIPPPYMYPPNQPLPGYYPAPPMQNNPVMPSFPSNGPAMTSYPASGTAMVGYPPPVGPAMMVPPPPGMLVHLPALPPIDPAKLEKIKKYIFVGSNGKIRALEQSGHGSTVEVWSDELKGAGYHMVHLLLNKNTGKLYAGTNGHLYCFDALSGKKEWEEKPKGQHGVFAEDLMTIHNTYDGCLLISCGNGYIIALNAFTGKMVWKHSLDQVGRCGCVAIVEHKGVLVVGVNGYVHGINLADGREIWKNSLKGHGYGPISLAAYTFSEHGSYSTDIAFVGTYGYIIAVSLSTGATMKEVNLKGTGYKPVAMLIDPPKNLLFAATSGELNCFKASSLNLVWKSDLPGMGYSFGHSMMFSGPDTIILGMNGRVTALKVSDGTVLWKSSPPGVGYGFVLVGGSSFPNLLLCAGAGRLALIDRSTGNPVNKNDLKGMGFMSVVLSTSAYNTDFNSSTLPQFIETERRNSNN